MSSTVAATGFFVTEPKLCHMVTCRNCECEYTADELVRHESERLVLVHCPDCRALLGRYRRHGDAPETDHLRDT
jgi:hypothetical protein